MRAIRLLSLRRLRLQPLRALLAAVVVGAGASLVVAILVISTSLTESVEQAGRALAGPAPLRVLGPVARGGIDAEVLGQIRSAEGVADAVPMIQAISNVDRTGGDDVAVLVLGFDCNIRALIPGLDVACTDESLAGLTTPIVGGALATEMGAGAQLRTNLGRIDLDGALALDQLDAINDGRVVAFPMPRAQRELGRPDGVDVVYVLPREGVRVETAEANVQRAIDSSFEVLGTDDPPPLVGVVLANFIPLFTMIALIALGIGAVLVRNSITLSLEERRRQIAIVGALGAPGRLLVWGTVAEMVVLGLVGGALGALGGIAVAHPVASGLDDVTRNLVGVPLDVRPTAFAVVVALLLGVGVAVGACIGPTRRAMRVDVAAELAGRGRREESVSLTSWGRIAVSALFTAAAVWVCWRAQADGGLEPWQSTAATLGFLATMAGSAYFIATVVPRLLGVVERRVAWRRAATRLAFANLRREPRRTGVMAIAIGFAVGVGFVTASFNESVSTAVRENLLENLDGVEVAAIDLDDALANEARLGPALLDELANLPGVATVERGITLAVGNQASELIAVSAFTNPWLDSDIALGELDGDRLAQGEVAIGVKLARDEGYRPGDLVPLDTLEGRVELPVMAVIYEGDFGGRSVFMDYDRLIELYGDQQPIAVQVTPQPGVSEDELVATIREAALDPSLSIRTLDEVIDRIAEQVAQNLSSFVAIQRGLLVMSFIAVLSTLLLVGIQRQREFGMLAAVGMTPAELRRMVVTEAALVAVVGTLIAGLVAIVQFGALLLITPVIVGYRDPFVLEGPALAQYAAVGIVVAVLAAVYPGRRAARVEVLDALRYE